MTDRNPRVQDLTARQRADLTRVHKLIREIGRKLPYRIGRALEALAADAPPWSQVNGAADAIGSPLTADERRLIARAGDRLEAAGINTTRLERDLGRVVARHEAVTAEAARYRAAVDEVFREAELEGFDTIRRWHWEALEELATEFAGYLRDVARGGVT